ncbi:zinc finger protein 316-like [Salarias fasciatus]|uniref:zinc finger protein 316-like n=1 Tax=Salarias fasciatus TaxID=181472 RepID=UPI0011767766|nr:zinc finger protein 316-like [Salarias fasciatus]
MCAVQLLRASVHERMGAAAADLLLRLEEGGEAAELPALRALLPERLAAAAEEIVALLEETVAEYEERLERSERELRGQRRLLDAVLQPRVLLSRADLQLPGEDRSRPDQNPEQDQNLEQDQSPEEDQNPEQDQNLEQDQSPEEDQNPDQDQNLEQDQSAPPLIKEEPQEAQISASSFSPAEVKTEEPQLPDSAGGGGGASAGGGASGLERDWDGRGDPEQQGVGCSFCGKRLGGGGELTRHMWLHTGERLLRCVVCHRRFPGERRLLDHSCLRPASPPRPASGPLRPASPPRPASGGLRPASPPRPAFGCPLCRRGFGSREELSAHAAAHVSCSVCDAAFADADALMLHMRSHGAQTRFSCSVCGKDFAWRRLLARHMEVHGGDRVQRARPARRRTVLRRNNGDWPAGPGPGPGPYCQPDSEDSGDSEDSDFWKDRRTPPGSPGGAGAAEEPLEAPGGRPVLGPVHLTGDRRGPEAGPLDSSETDVSDEDWTRPAGWNQVDGADGGDGGDSLDSVDSDFWRDRSSWGAPQRVSPEAYRSCLPS